MAERALDIEGERDILRGADELLPRAADLHQAMLLESGKAGPVPLADLRLGDAASYDLVQDPGCPVVHAVVACAQATGPVPVGAGPVTSRMRRR